MLRSIFYVIFYFISHRCLTMLYKIFLNIFVRNGAHLKYIIYICIVLLFIFYLLVINNLKYVTYENQIIR